MKPRKLAGIIFVLLFRPSICWANEKEFVDPNDIFHFDPNSVQMVGQQHQKNSKTKDETAPDKPTVVLPDVGLNTQHDALTTTSEPPKHNLSQEPDKTATNTEPHCPEPHCPEPRCPESKETKTVVEVPDPDSILRCGKKKITVKGLQTLFQQLTSKMVNLLDERVDKRTNQVDACMRVHVSAYDFAKLKKYSGGESCDSYSNHDLLNHLFQEVTDLPSHGPFYWLEERLGLSVPVLLWLSAMMVAVILILHMLLRLSTFGLFGLIKYIIFAAFLVSIPFSWMELYQKNVADQEKALSSKMTAKCPQLQEQTLWTRMNNFVFSSLTFQDEECREFYHAMFVNPVIKATPIEAISIAFVKTFVTPLRTVGEGIRGFLIGLFMGMPFHHIVITFILMIVVIFFTFMFVSGCIIRTPLATFQLGQAAQLTQPAIFQQPMPLPVANAPQAVAQAVAPPAAAPPAVAPLAVAPPAVAAPAVAALAVAPPAAAPPAVAAHAATQIVEPMGNVPGSISMTVQGNALTLSNLASGQQPQMFGTYPPNSGQMPLQANFQRGQQLQMSQTKRTNSQQSPLSNGNPASHQQLHTSSLHSANSQQLQSSISSLANVRQPAASYANLAAGQRDVHSDAPGSVDSSLNHPKAPKSQPTIADSGDNRKNVKSYPNNVSKENATLDVPKKLAAQVSHTQLDAQTTLKAAAQRHAQNAPVAKAASEAITRPMVMNTFEESLEDIQTDKDVTDSKRRLAYSDLFRDWELLSLSSNLDSLAPSTNSDWKKVDAGASSLLGEQEEEFQNHPGDSGDTAGCQASDKSILEDFVCPDERDVCES